ncbi:hypothetical protein [Roseovarius salis]|uniref:hypothetical protein n=1 Tax=Roseovarius salis TaxID=3376063 RepID=UPI0037CA3D3A
MMAMTYKVPMSFRPLGLWAIALIVIGALWALYAPNCLGTSFSYVAIFGAGVFCFIFGTFFGLGASGSNGDQLIGTSRSEQDSGYSDILRSNVWLTMIYAFLFGWVGLIMSLITVGSGWMLGILACFNVLPELGDYRCIECQGMK